MTEATKTVDFAQLPQPILDAHPEWVALYHFAWQVASRNIRHSRGRWHMDAAWDPTRNYQWVWDTCFMALYCRYAADQYPGVESLDNFYELQSEDGYISMTYDFATGQEVWPDRINPPLFAWVEWEHYRATGDASRFERVIPHIERLVDWIDANRRNAPHRRRRAVDSPPEGLGESNETFQLYYFKDCGSSGMDDSPRTPRIADAGQFFDWIDLSCQMAYAFLALARMHEVLGAGERAAHWRERWDTLGRLINDELWCERTAFYHDRSLPRNFVGHKTAAGFWPVLAEICPADRRAELAAHLRNPAEFARPTPVPTLTADDPNYDPKGTYWVGGVWAPTNYMIARGLMLNGEAELAHEIAAKYLAGLSRTFDAVEPHTLWECNSPEYDRPGLAAYTGKSVKPDFVGWSGLGPIAMLIENVIGIDARVPDSRIDWQIRLTERHGIRNLAFGEGRVDLLCEPRDGREEPAQVTVSATVPVTCRIARESQKQTVNVTPGTPVQLVV